MATVRLLVLVLGLLGPHWPNKVSANWMYLGVSGVSPSSYLYQQHPTVGPHSAEPEDPMGPTAEARALCSSLPGISSQQVEVCLQQPAVMQAVASGAARGIDECQHQFRNERWNCSTQNDENNLFGSTLERGSKETAFIYAVTSAGVVHAVTQACSSGNLTDCSCDASKQGQSTREGWKWGGCSDNMKYGVGFARNFVDVLEKRKPGSIRAKMNLHNNAAGRQVVSTLMKMQCRCHGVSGSCELKTCWQTMPSFSEVGDLLKNKYRLAVQVAAKAKKRLRRKSKTKRGGPVNKGDLVHIHKSPNYCVEDAGKGIPGTAGRVCNKSSTGPDSCDLLCCGRGYNTQVKKHIERCHCKFVWCCYVKCKTCETTIDLHTCK
ncbi:protein Wnt-16-like isoform X2 [Neocloeon triangulifer]|uniref:protein Wnt-16-like isoform X2 n=1 Tax=Neocloeon triangulifer TaxID=2078957 RepID=UPI00286F3B5B|nr:protein Wnt-16-like isoform X2 [Neocloeon triangulifer]